MKPSSMGAGILLFGLAVAANAAETAERRRGGHGPNRPAVSGASRFDVSPPLRSMAPAPLGPREPRQVPIQKRDRARHARPAPLSRDPLLDAQDPLGPRELMPDPILTFEGITDDDNERVAGGPTVPPDTNGDVGPDHYVQFNNVVFEVFDKRTGDSVFGPFPGNALFAGFGGPCEDTNDGDPLALYDQLADRWILSQFAIEYGTQCVAVSTTPDPAGSYYRYAFGVTPGYLNDYPKLAVWPDAYYSTYRRFPAEEFAIVAAAFEREKMLAGDPLARLVTFVLDPPEGSGCLFGGICYDGVLPSHLEGLTPPPAGSPNFFVMVNDDELNGGAPAPDPTKDVYHVWRFHVDWTTPTSSTFTGPVNVAAPEMDAMLCGLAADCVPQPDTDQGLDALSGWTMYRAVYRNFGTHDALWTNTTVNVGGERAGIRWAEIRAPGGAPVLHQSGTHAPDDGVHRWMGSLSVDKAGNMALGYSASGTHVYPSLRYAGRLRGDPLGALAQGESEMYAGTGSQVHSFHRWGDYSSMSVDEADGCTFWFTSEYYETTGSFDFKTRVGSFQFPTCDAEATGFITGHVRDAASGAALAEVRVAAGLFSTQTDGGGRYSVEVPSGTHDVQASIYGYVPRTETGVVVGDGATVERDFALTAEQTVRLRGTVADGSGAGWPLAATVRIVPRSGPVQTRQTDPRTGAYEALVAANTTYDLKVIPGVPGYLPQDRRMSLEGADRNESFALLIDARSCAAPGYGFFGETLAATDFESGLPAGWTVTNATIACGSVPHWTDTDPGRRGNETGGGGKFMIADSDACGSSATSMNTDLVSPPLDLSGLGGANALHIAFNSDYGDLCNRDEDEVSLDVWNGSSWVTVFDMCGDHRFTRRESFATTAANGVRDARVRWHYVADWDWWWMVDDVAITASSCRFGGGGKLEGNVYDANTGEPLNGAVVSVDGGGTVTTAATPADPHRDDGYYVLYPPPGSRTVTASFGAYRSHDRTLAVTSGAVMTEDFRLAAGRLAAPAPTPLRRRLAAGTSEAVNLSLRNTGTAAAAFTLFEIDAPLPPPPVAGPLGPARTSRDRRAGPPDAEAAAGGAFAVDTTFLPAGRGAGALVSRFDTGFAAPWGIGVDTHAGDLWVGDSDTSLNHRFTTDGVDTGDTIDLWPFVGPFAADMAFNARTGKLWQVNTRSAFGDNCIHELDPIARTVTGRRICPAFSAPEDIARPLRGLAYNAVTDTYYIGTWLGETVTEVDGTGRVLRDVWVDLPISGLAMNPRSGHLFAQTRSEHTSIWVMDVNDDFRIKAGFAFEGPDGLAYDAFAGAGLEMDCAGRLWSVNLRTGEVFANESGETDTCVDGIDWLGLSPPSGSVDPASTSELAVTFATDGVPNGCHEGHLAGATDTPYGGFAVPVGLTVEFSDVPASVKGERYVHALAGAGVTQGCAKGRFCPSRPLVRSVAAQWLLRSKLGADYAPPPAQGLFADLRPDAPLAAWAEDLYGRGIIAACGTSPLRFCPNRSVTRQEMAVLLLKAREGPAYSPPACAGRFADVACTAPEAAWIEDAFQRGILPACGRGERRFCPARAMTRAQSAEADAKAFGIAPCQQ